MDVIKNNYDKFEKMQEDYRDTKFKLLWKEDYEKDRKNYATVKKLAVVEQMISMVPTIDKLEETTFMIEQKIKRV